MTPAEDMARFVLLLRGINVGGNNRIPMRELQMVLQGIGLQNVSWYIQSGNVVFDADEGESETLESSIEQAIAGRFGFVVPAMLIRRIEFEAAVESCPFDEDASEKTVLVFFSGVGARDWAEKAKASSVPTESLVITDDVAYLYAPGGLAGSKSAQALLAKPANGVKATMRNWRTVNKIMELLGK